MLTVDIILTFRIKELKKNLKQDTGTIIFAHERTGSSGV